MAASSSGPNQKSLSKLPAASLIQTSKFQVPLGAPLATTYLASQVESVGDPDACSISSQPPDCLNDGVPVGKAWAGHKTRSTGPARSSVTWMVAWIECDADRTSTAVLLRLIAWRTGISRSTTVLMTVKAPTAVVSAQRPTRSRTKMSTSRGPGVMKRGTRTVAAQIPSRVVPDTSLARLPIWTLLTPVSSVTCASSRTVRASSLTSTVAGVAVTSPITGLDASTTQRICWSLGSVGASHTLNPSPPSTSSPPGPPVSTSSPAPPLWVSSPKWPASLSRPDRPPGDRRRPRRPHRRRRPRLRSCLCRHPRGGCPCRRHR